MTAVLAGLRIGLLSNWASRAGGGVFEAVVRQADMIQALGGEPRVFAVDHGHVDEDSARFAPGSLTLCHQVGPAAVGFSPEMVSRLVEADLDVLHLHGIWMYASAAGAAWARRTGKPYIVSPHGMLDPWITARGRWKKALARAGYERRNWAIATCLHGLTPREADDVRAETGRTDTVVIPNAGPDPVVQVGSLPPPQMVYIGRIHSKKNLLALVAAWKAITRPTEARLILAGWGDAPDVAKLESAIEGEDSIAFVGPIFGKAKDALIAESRFIVLPSLSEGLPMAILEAWAAGVPTVMTTECNLPEGFEAGAALECGYDAASIGEALSRALALDEISWRTMAKNARDLAADRFSADRVAAMWGQTYARLARSPA